MSERTEQGRLRKDLPDVTEGLLDVLAELAFSLGSKRESGPVCWCCPTCREEEGDGDLPRYIFCKNALCQKACAAFKKAKYRDTWYEFGDLAVGMELEAQTFLGEWRPARVVELERTGMLKIAWISWASCPPVDGIEVGEIKSLDELRPIGGGV